MSQWISFVLWKLPYWDSFLSKYLTDLFDVVMILEATVMGENERMGRDDTD
jgi:hypothetical protein